MWVIDPGHSYRLYSLDGDQSIELTFVKREGPGYPGNVGAHPGTNLQEVLRACIDRLEYLHAQIPDTRTIGAGTCLRLAMSLLEHRAADRHGRPDPSIQGFSVVSDDFCTTCGHVGCDGDCQLAPAPGHGGDEDAG